MTTVTRLAQLSHRDNSDRRPARAAARSLFIIVMLAVATFTCILALDRLGHYAQAGGDARPVIIRF